jgi:hypothetical protein
MEAKKYLEEKIRMFDSLRDKCKGQQNCTGIYCIDCPFFKDTGCIVHSIDSIEIVEKWSQEHPRKTMLMDFLDKHPKALLVNNRTPKGICPYILGYEKEAYCTDISGAPCVECWNRDYE